MKEVLTDFWYAMTGPQRRVTVGVLLLISACFIGGWYNAFAGWRANRALENEAKTARRDADAALKRAATIAAAIREQEEELRELEAKRNVEQKQLEKSAARTGDAQRDYDRTLTEPVTGTPSADELCADLAKLGYPCR
ncbi:MAG: hypothetical protein IPN69_08180 [Acidobacteria bacterium]|nr:hypothetical protein [Acidobacteriota bacterium]